MKKLSGRMGGGILAALALLLFFACNKNDSAGSAPNPNKNKLSVYLTDGPGLFDQVLVDVQGVAVKIDTASAWWGKEDDKGPGHHGHSGFGQQSGNHDHQDQTAVWDTLPVTPGIYDLLHFANGADTLLASANITKGKIIAFRLTLGDRNSLVKDSVSYPLTLAPGWDNIYIRVFGPNFEKVNSDHYKIWIDFDAGRSVIRVLQGAFVLKPVLRAFAVSNTGGVLGTVMPPDALAVVSVFNDTDTAYAIPGRGGMFMVRGLPEGSYSVFVNASNGYQDTTLTGVAVSAGKQTDVGPVQLHQ